MTDDILVYFYIKLSLSSHSSGESRKSMIFLWMMPLFEKSCLSPLTTYLG